ncbi:phage/plasmid replication protein [Bacillus sp. Marseille-Q1617]|uniref:phage/plasmid replication domain-containing protein n=1 Tax=Bacillus sp. Marseille-Q1617 TaxID=2736887 RepID=UPI00158BAB42|nr:phage/plasmid replication protein [Bacillus sp. Marseille-Q1617]
MIHTFEIMILISYEDFHHLFSMYGVRLNKYHYVRAAVKELNKEIKKSLPAYAITRTWEQVNGDWNLQLKVDAIKMLNRGTITEEDYELIELDIRRFLIRHFGHSDYFDSHTLTRIDYRMDVELPNPKDRELLFHLLEKYTAKYAFKEKINWGKDENGNPVKYETSQYHKCKSIELIIYDKEEERIANNEEIQSYDSGRIRYELRLKNSHLNSMKRKDKGKGRPKELKSYFSYQLWKEYMEKHVLPIVHRGDYFKITEAEKIIENSNFSKRKKDDLRAFLVMISRGNIDTPKQHMSLPTYRKYLRDLASIGVSPILIPKNRTDFPNCLKNPLKI